MGKSSAVILAPRDVNIFAGFFVQERSSRSCARRKQRNIMKTNSTIEATRTALLLGFCLAGASFGVIGCQNTVEGVSADAQKDTAAVRNAAEKTADATKDAADKAAMATKETVDKAAVATRGAAGDAGDRLTMTPKVKDAIVSNATLNNVKNKINVDTAKGVVYLKGHVLSNEQRKLAGDIAAKTVKEAGSQDKVMNELTVENH
jgi:osmotically-inducible protein OsmY